MGSVVMLASAAMRVAAGDPCEEVDAAAANGAATGRGTMLNMVDLADNRSLWRWETFCTWY